MNRGGKRQQLGNVNTDLTITKPLFLLVMIVYFNMYNKYILMHFVGAEVQHHCLELAATQAQTSSSASLFLGVWLAPPLIHSLSVSGH